MSTTKKIGIILILIGICLPISLLGFASGYHSRVGIIGNIQDMEIVIRKEHSPYPPPAPIKGQKNSYFDCIVDKMYDKEGSHTSEWCEEYDKYLKSIKPEISISYKYIFCLWSCFSVHRDRLYYVITK